MRKIALAFAILGTTLTTALYTAPAHAQATRTWVSGVGDDANPCSRTAPCKTFAGAISKTAAGGEIDALDPGGFGALTITKSITIDGGGGQVASVLVSGTNGFVVAAGTTDVVIIKNLRFQGLLGNGSNPGGAGINGIKVITAGQVDIDNCEIYGFNNNGIDVELNSTGFVQVLHTQLFNNKGNGIFATTSSGAAVVQVYGSTVVNTNSAGTQLGGGVLAGVNSFITVGNTNFQDLSYGAQVQAGGNLNVDTSLFSSTTNGILTNGGTAAAASNNSFYSGVAFGGTGTVNTANNNKIGGAATVGSASVNSSGITIK
jgi:hypothetical protein